MAGSASRLAPALATLTPLTPSAAVHSHPLLVVSSRSVKPPGPRSPESVNSKSNLPEGSSNLDETDVSGSRGATWS